MRHRKEMPTNAEMGLGVQDGPDRLMMTRGGHEEESGLFREIFPNEKQYEYREVVLRRKSRRTQRGGNFWTL